MNHGRRRPAGWRSWRPSAASTLSRSFAYSDSLNEPPMLEMVGTPVAVNPDRRLLQVARRRGWDVLDYRNARRRTMVASAAGGVAAGAAAAATPRLPRGASTNGPNGLNDANG
jgi:hypothetical protein